MGPTSKWPQFNPRLGPRGSPGGGRREAGGSNLMKLPIELTTIIYNKENRIANEYRQPELNQYIFLKMN